MELERSMVRPQGLQLLRAVSAAMITAKEKEVASKAAAILANDPGPLQIAEEGGRWFRIYPSGR